MFSLDKAYKGIYYLRNISISSYLRYILLVEYVLKKKKLFTWATSWFINKLIYEVFHYSRKILAYLFAFKMKLIHF